MKTIAIILVICLWVNLFVNLGETNVLLNVATTFVVLKLLKDRKRD
ncbi:hypothetical protein Newbould305_2070 [Staphylococcus aureus subsp. aureus str. Newbould 305]|nr:hypothetical protein Newbould305_2070 [Staphylococcus aureus subsp. aureus str. Newbould 305]